MSELALTPSEQAYFDSGGATLPADAGAPAADQQPIAQPQEQAVAPAEPAQQQPQQQQQPRLVPLEALHEERERRKELAREVEQMRAWRQQLEERFRQAQQQAAPPPSFDDNPVDAAKYGIQQTAAQVDQVKAELDQLRAAEVARQIDQHVAASEQQFAAKQPDYFEAVQHLQRLRHDTYRALGATEEQIPALLEGERQQLLRHALQTRADVPSMVYQLAKTWGYQPRQGGQQPAGQRLATLQAGQQAAVTLGALPGTSGAPLTAQALAEMSDAEFAKTLEKNPDLFRKVMGG